jgi:hypothetical protein
VGGWSLGRGGTREGCFDLVKYLGETVSDLVRFLARAYPGEPTQAMHPRRQHEFLHHHNTHHGACDINRCAIACAIERFRVHHGGCRGGGGNGVARSMCPPAGETPLEALQFGRKPPRKGWVVGPWGGLTW